MASNSPFRTSSDLVIQVLNDTGIISTGEPIDPADFNTVNDNLDSIFRKLAGLEIVFVADPQNIPGEWFKDLVSIVSGECGSLLGLVGNELNDKINNGLGGAPGTPVEIGAGTSAKSLKIITRGRPTYETQRFLNF